MRLRYLLLPLVLVFAAVLGGPSASGDSMGSSYAAGRSAGQYSPPLCSIALSKTQAKVGESVVVTGANAAPNRSGALELRSAPVSLGSVQTDGNGSFTKTITIPAGTSLGAHAVVFICPTVGGGTTEATAGLQVIGSGAVAADTTASGPLSRTGAALTVPAGLAGIVLIAVGSLAVMAVRRKRAVA